MTTGRYAPSPTGRLHLGNLRSALLAWLHVRLCNGQFILRMDDLDTPRNVPGAQAQLIADMQWLGLHWDQGPHFQSQRLEHYDQAFNQLKSMDALFPCQCSRKDIALALSAPHQDHPAGVYPGTCRSLDLDTLNSPVSWRFRTEDLVIEFKDYVCGHQCQDLEKAVGDFIVKRKDGLFAYQLASVVDDHLMGVTDVIRGEDLIDSTPRQIALAQALNYAQSQYWHVPMMRDQSGNIFSKRDGSDSLIQWQEQYGHGIDAATKLIGLFAYSLGLIDKNSGLSCVELLQELTFDEFCKKLQREYNPDKF